MQKYEDALWGGVAAIRSHSFGMDYREWQRYASTLEIETKYPGINGIGVIFHVPPEKRESFLAQERQQRPDFRIHPQHQRNVYMPITFIEPVASNAKAVGLDIAHEDNRFTAALKARDTGQAQITGPIVLVQDSEKTPGFLFYAPFYSGDNAEHTTQAQREQQFTGLVYAPFIFKKLLKGTLDETKRSVGLRITDGSHVMYDELNETNQDFDKKPLFKKTFRSDIYGREWEFDIWSTKTFRQQTHSNQPWIILAGGIFIDSILLLLFILLARSNRYTLDFAARMTNSYRKKTMDLEHANMELEEFAYRTSHDLRSPITSSIGLLDMAKRSIEKGQNDTALSGIDYASKSLSTLKKLIDDILTLTKTKSLSEAPEKISINSLIEDSLNVLSYMENVDRLTIIKHFDLNEDIFSKRLRLKLIIENLLSNAIKYQDMTKTDSYIKISTHTSETNPSLFCIRIEDNGLGIPKEYQGDLFSMFKRFHVQAAEGSGLGLYMIKKSARIIEGEIMFTDTDNGSIFVLTAPKELKEDNE